MRPLLQGAGNVMTGDSSVTGLLIRWGQGDRSVEGELARQLYPMLRQLAAAHARRSGDALTLRPTELVHELYLRLREQRRDDWTGRAHFLGFAAGVLRHVIVDYIRERSAQKRGGGRLFVEISELSDTDSPAVPDDVDWLAVDQALQELEGLDAECAKVVELKIFGGLGMEEIAQVLDQSIATVGRRWRFARSWLAQRLDPESPSS